MLLMVPFTWAAGQRSAQPAVLSQATLVASARCGTTPQWSAEQQVRWNTDLQTFEAWDGTNWLPVHNTPRPADDDETPIVKVTEQNKLTATGGTGSRHFGHAVHMNGDMAIVGAPNYNKVGSPTNMGATGLAFVFARNGANWNQVAVLAASDGKNGDLFGTAVAISGNTALVGAKQAAVSGKKWQGAAYVFVAGRQGGWTQQAKLTANDGTNADFFGNAVALEGNTALVAAASDDIGNAADRGSVYSFVRSGSSWTQQAKLVASDGSANDGFGTAISVDGMYAVVGAQNNANGAGAAYVFARNGLGWAQAGKLVATGTASKAFGYSVSISGRHIIIGSLHDDNGPGVSSGAAYIFERDGQAWRQQARLICTDTASARYFGMSVSTNGDYAIIGSVHHDVGTGTNTARGSAYVYLRTGACWNQQEILTASDAAADDWFGFSVSISGSRAIVGAVWHDSSGNTNQGAAYIYRTNRQRPCD
jgi:hypothetical protein